MQSSADCSESSVMNPKENEQYSKMVRIKKIFHKIFASSTSHGLPNMFRAEKKEFKIMYFSAFIICLALCAFMMVKSISDYVKYDVVTEIDVIYEVPTQFPTVTLFSLKNPTANTNLDEILINCYFNDDHCDSSDFSVKRDKFGYVSYQFNERKLNKSSGFKQTTTAGKINGLQVELFSVSNEIKRDDFSARYFRFDGFQVVVHNHSNDPRYYGGISSGSDACEVAPGFSTNLIINRVFNYKLERPYNQCDKDFNEIDSFNSDIFRFMIKSSNFSYRQKDCFDYCIAQELIKKCHLDAEPCNQVNIFEMFKSNYTQIGCILRVYNDLVDGQINDICVPLCPLECDSISYELSTSFSRFPKRSYAKELMSNSKIKSKFPANYTITYEDLLKNMIAINVYYNDLKYTQISQIPKTNIIDLISNLGGILGLFIGISFLTFGELAELIMEIMFILFEDKDKYKNMPYRIRV